MEPLRNKTTRLLLVSLLSVVGLVLIPSLLMQAFGWPTAIGPIRSWILVLNQDWGDSWVAIADALEYVTAHGAAGLYEQTYYHSAFQFIYPPTSLVPVVLTDRVGLLNWYSVVAMNAVSWWLVPVAIAMLAVITLTALARQGARIATADVLLAILLSVVTIFLFFPFMHGVRVGQIQTWLTLLLMLALLAWLLGRKVAAGVAVGLVCVIKPPLGLLVLWGALRREWRFAAALLITGAVFAVASVAMFGWQVHAEYLHLIGFLSRRGESYFANQSVNGLLNRMLFIGNNLDWDGTHTQTTYDARVHAATVASSLALIALVLLYRWRATAGPLDFGFALIGFTLASPVAYEHHFGFLPVVFLFLLLALRAHAAGSGAYVLLAVAFALCANFFGVTDALAATHLNFLQSHLLFGVLLLLGMLVWVTGRQDTSARSTAVGTTPILR